MGPDRFSYNDRREIIVHGRGRIPSMRRVGVFLVKYSVSGNPMRDAKTICTQEMYASDSTEARALLIADVRRHEPRDAAVIVHGVETKVAP